MDSKIREWGRSLLCEVNRITAYHRHGQKVSDAMLDRLSNYQVDAEEALAILTPEPEPCEDARKAAQDFAAWLDVNAHDSYPVDSVWYDQLVQRFESYASQVADKRVEELRAQLDRANATLEEVAAQRNRSMEDVETLRDGLDFYREDKLRMSAKTALMFLKAKKDKTNLDIDMIKSFEEALAATEPKT